MNLKDITILVPGGMQPRVLERLEKTFNLVRTEGMNPAQITDEMKAGVRGMAAAPSIAGGGVTPALMDALPNLEIVANFGVGYDGVDAAYAGQHNIMVTNTPDVLTEEVADTAIGLLLNTLREFNRAENFLRAGRWVSEGHYPLSRGSLQGSKAGIVGMGRIGQAIARRLQAFGVPTAYHNRRPVEGVTLEYFPTLTGLAGAVDILISVLPGGAATAKAINTDVLAALGPKGVFISIGRGSAVDEDALATALHSGMIMAAGLDVFADEPNVPQSLLDAPNATLLPHVGSASVKTRNMMADLVVDNLINWFEKGAALTAVPETAHAAPRK